MSVGLNTLGFLSLSTIWVAASTVATVDDLPLESAPPRVMALALCGALWLIAMTVHWWRAAPIVDRLATAVPLPATKAVLVETTGRDRYEADVVVVVAIARSAVVTGTAVGRRTVLLSEGSAADRPPRTRI